MDLTLYSKRLKISPLSEHDSDIAVQVWTNPEVVRFICDPLTRDEVLEEMPDSVRRAANGAIGIWVISDETSGQKIGSCYLLPMPTTEDDVDYSALDMEVMPDGDIEVGYFLLPVAWGKGYATEICERLLRFAFEETPLTDLVASVHEDNKASQYVLQKCGMHYGSHEMCWGKRTPLYRISRQQWLAHPQ